MQIISKYWFEHSTLNIQLWIDSCIKYEIMFDCVTIFFLWQRSFFIFQQIHRKLAFHLINDTPNGRFSVHFRFTCELLIQYLYCINFGHCRQLNDIKGDMKLLHLNDGSKVEKWKEIFEQRNEERKIKTQIFPLRHLLWFQNNLVCIKSISKYMFAVKREFFCIVKQIE